MNCQRSAAACWSKSSKRGVGAGVVGTRRTGVALTVIIARLLTGAERSGTYSIESVCLFIYSDKIKFQEDFKSVVDPNSAACSNTVLGQPAPH